MQVHILKCWRESFEDIVSEEKKFDYRRSDDREYEKGDVLFLEEFDPEENSATGRIAGARVEYVLSGELAPPEWGLPKNHSVLGIKLLWLAKIQDRYP